MAECNVISHRGANQIAPQNTLPAFRKSIQYKADGFETDVHLTRDGIPVICHNYTIDKTSNGKGLITSQTLEQLKKLDFGSAFHHSFKNTKMPTLDELLKLVSEAEFKILNIEIKPPKNKDCSVAQKVIDACKEYSLFDKLLISSFDPDVLMYAKDVDEACKTAILYGPNTSIGYKIRSKAANYAKSIGADALHPHHIFVDRAYVEFAHENGIMVNPWTVNSESTIKKLVKLGVDGVITDVPNVAKRIINSL